MARPARVKIENPTGSQIADAIAVARAGNAALAAIGCKTIAEATAKLVSMNASQANA